MARTRTFNYRVATLFPPDDEYASTMARICILWEDFITEASAGRQTSIKEMDGNSPEWRRFYFFRRSIGTVNELRGAICHLRSQKEFRDVLSKQPQPDRECFEERYRRLEQHGETIKQFRNDIGGGHVRQKPVSEGLRKLDPELLGMYQIGEHRGDMRFKFTHQLVLAVMFPNIHEKNPEQEIEEFLKVMQEATSNALHIVDFVFWIYLKERGIRPL